MADENRARLMGYWRMIGAASRDSQLSKADVAVLWSVLQRINKETLSTFPSLETIAADAGVSRRSAPRSINRLCERGYLTKEKRKGKGGDRSNVYRAGSIPDSPVTDESVSDNPVTDRPVPQSLTALAVRGVTSSSDIPASKSYQLSVPAEKEEPDASRPVDPIWGTGLQFLQSKGVREKDGRGYLGRLIKEIGPIQTRALLAQAEDDDVIDPIAWLAKAAAIRSRRGTSGGRLARDSRTDDELASANEEALARLGATA
jgi:hypothetical protein